MHIRLYAWIFTFFFLEKLIGLITSDLAVVPEQMVFLSIILEAIDVILEIGIFGLLFYFIHFLYGIIDRKKIVIIGLLYLFPWFLQIAEPLPITDVYPRFFSLIKNLSILPLFLYFTVLWYFSYRKIKKRSIQLLFVFTLIIVSSISFVMVMDGFLEVFLAVNIPKDPVSVTIFCIATLIYIPLFSSYLKSTESVIPDNFLEKYNISKREREIIQLLLKGNSYKEIAETLFISPATVKTHVHNIYVKTKSSNRHALMYTIQTW